MKIAYAAVFLLCLSFLCYNWIRKGSSKLPPGPQPRPLIGNIYQIPTSYPWKQFQEWHKSYGPIVHLRIGHRTLVLLGSHQVAKEILNKRSNNYSSRPRLVVAEECVAKGLDTALLPYGERWRRFHAVQTTFLNSRKSQLYRPLQDLESRHLLFDLLSTNDFGHELYRYSSSLMYALLYGRRFTSGKDPKLKELERLFTAMFETMSSTTLGNWVDSFPILNYLPRPLAPWKNMGDKLHRQAADLNGKNFNDALNTASWNWCKQSISKNTAAPVSPEELTFILGDLFGAGGRTTAGALNVAVLACVSYPAALHRAQAELDTHVGSARLPTFEDLPNLPYVRGFVEEVFRWRPLTPAGVAHAAMKDDEYNGFRIPKGASVVANHWSLEMDEKVFRDPEEFVPERWLDQNAELPSAAFGFGKRVCPGQYLARNSLLVVVTRLLWTFDIRWKEGQAIRSPECVGMTREGILSQPCPFEARFEVRSNERREIVVREWKDLDSNADSFLTAIGREFAAI